MSWTDERIALLKKMWKEGKSAADIAKTLGKGVTRNAVIGKAHRMGLSGRPSPIKKPAPAKKEAVAKKQPTVVASSPRTSSAASKKKAAAPSAAKLNAALAKEVEEMKRLESAGPQVGGGVALIDLTERMCKWPIGDPKEADFSFCGLAIRVGTPYCPEHAAMAYQTSSRRSAAQAKGRGGEVEVVEDEDDIEVEDDADTDTDDADEEDVA